MHIWHIAERNVQQHIFNIIYFKAIQFTISESIISLKCRTANIKPNQNHSATDRIDPLQYRGVSLLSNIHKIYTPVF